MTHAKQGMHQELVQPLHWLVPSCMLPLQLRSSLQWWDILVIRPYSMGTACQWQYTAVAPACWPVHWDFRPLLLSAEVYSGARESGGLLSSLGYNFYSSNVRCTVHNWKCMGCVPVCWRLPSCAPALEVEVAGAAGELVGPAGAKEAGLRERPPCWCCPPRRPAHHTAVCITPSCPALWHNLLTRLLLPAQRCALR